MTTKSLFETESLEKVPQLLPEESPEKDPIMSGAFFIKGEELISDIHLEFDVKHPQFNVYMNRLKDFVKECEKIHVLKSSSGV